MKEENEDDIFSQLKKTLEEPANLQNENLPESKDEPQIGGDAGIEGPETFSEVSFGNRQSLAERSDSGESSDGQTLEKKRDEKKRFSGLMSLIKPDGHLNKPVIAGIVFIILFLLFVFLPGGGDERDELAENKVKAEKLPNSSSDELTGVSPGSVSDSNSNSKPGDDSILGNSNSNANTSVTGIGENSNSMANTTGQNFNQPVTSTTTKTYTTIEPQNMGSTQNGQTTTNVPQPARETQVQRRQMSDDFTVDFGEGEQNNSRRETAVRERDYTDSDIPVKQLRVMPGTKIQMALNEPFRSGIETKVQAICLNNVKGVDGKVIIPSNTIFEFTFRPEEVSGRVLARNVARVYLPDGQIGEVAGIVKGADGYAGLTGKITKQNDRGLGGKILGGLARVTAGRIGQIGEVGSDVENEINNTGVTDRDANISRSSRVVEIVKGTRFYLYVGTPE